MKLVTLYLSTDPQAKVLIKTLENLQKRWQSENLMLNQATGFVKIKLALRERHLKI